MFSVSANIEMPPALRFWKGRLGIQAVLMAYANAARELTIDNFKRLGAKAKYSVNFYEHHGASQTHVYDRETYAEMRVDDYIMEHKLVGGFEFPKSVDHLAIPISDEAKRAGNPAHFLMGKLFPILTGSRIFLASRDSGMNTFSIAFVLLISVFHRPHPETMPSLRSMAQRGTESALDMLLAYGAIKKI